MLGVTAATDGTTAGGTTAGGTTAGGTTADGGQPRSTMETKEWLESINRRHNLSETRATMSLAADGADDAGGVVFDHSLDTSSALGNGQERVRVLSRARVKNTRGRKRKGRYRKGVKSQRVGER